MSKKEISWIGLINALIAERKKAGKPAGVKDVMGDAKKQWVDIKAGKDPKYVKGKPNITPQEGQEEQEGQDRKELGAKQLTTTTPAHRRFSTSASSARNA